MIINFAKVTVKALPNGDNSLGISLAVNDNAALQPSHLQTTAIDTTTLTAPQLQCLNDFIALLNSKL